MQQQQQQLNSLKCVVVGDGAVGKLLLGGGKGLLVFARLTAAGGCCIKLVFREQRTNKSSGTVYTLTALLRGQCKLFLKAYWYVVPRRLILCNSLCSFRCRKDVDAHNLHEERVSRRVRADGL